MLESFGMMYVQVKSRNAKIVKLAMFTGHEKWCRNEYESWNSIKLQYPGVVQFSEVSPKMATPLSRTCILKIAKNQAFLLLQNHDFCCFQNACPRKWCGHFRWNSTELNYSRVLHIDGVSACVLIPITLCMTCEHGRQSDFCIIGYQDFWPCAQVMQSGVGMSTKAETPSIWSIQP